MYIYIYIYIISYPPCKKGIRQAERRYQAVSLFYKENNEFIISYPLILTLNFKNDNKEIGYFFNFFNFFLFIIFIYIYIYIFF